MISYTMATVAETLGTSTRTVSVWVATGELRAINISRSRSSRKPRLRIMAADLEAFLSSRAVGHEPARPRRRTALKITKEYV